MLWKEYWLVYESSHKNHSSFHVLASLSLSVFIKDTPIFILCFFYETWYWDISKKSLDCWGCLDIGVYVSMYVHWSLCWCVCLSRLVLILEMNIICTQSDTQLWCYLQTFEIIKRTQLQKYHQAETEEEKALIECNPINIIHSAVENTRPLLQLTPIKRGGVKYQVCAS